MEFEMRYKPILHSVKLYSPCILSCWSGSLGASPISSLSILAYVWHHSDTSSVQRTACISLTLSSEQSCSAHLSCLYIKRGAWTSTVHICYFLEFANWLSPHSLNPLLVFVKTQGLFCLISCRQFHIFFSLMDQSHLHFCLMPPCSVFFGRAILFSILW